MDEEGDVISSSRLEPYVCPVRQHSPALYAKQKRYPRASKRHHAELSLSSRSLCMYIIIINQKGEESQFNNPCLGRGKRQK